MRIGIPHETRWEERRIALAPAGVDSLVRAGHTVYLQSGAGESSHFSNEDYRNVGATIVYNVEEVFGRSELVTKVAPITEEEAGLLVDNQILLSFMHLAVGRKNIVDILLKKKITAIGLELIERDSRLPILQSMSEIAGPLAIQVAERYLESYTKDGRGILLGGITGVAPAAIVILGAGVVGITAARAALGRGAQVIVIDTDLDRLRHVETEFNTGITTVMANPYTISRGVRFADVLIGAVLIKGEKTPHVVNEEMVKQMKKGAVIVDVSIDQGGCIETSRITTISNPVFSIHNVIHYCVPNMPTLVSRTASYGLTNSSLEYILSIAENGLSNALMEDKGLTKGVCTYNGNCTNEFLANSFDFNYKKIHIFSTN
ncbi:MAG: alanine dehydrogenase [Ignavibacteriaceae bacterium]|nr:alanine dehydrogenase [Ignavibacteria bacterium]MBT8392449.1 alanine dehydrogenase [Ignavibacteria bacterium]NNJ53518.1 alanine dehydrogenase [Ignavibacteriaceae bacterium]